MTKIALVALVALSLPAAALVAPAGAQQGPLRTAAETSFSSATKIFVLEAASDDLLAIETGKLAVAADEGRIKVFARKMIADRTRMMKELEEIVNGKVAFSVPSSLDEVQAGRVDKLKGLTRAEFAKAYLSLQVSINQEAVARFERYRQDGDNAELKGLANRHLLQLREDGQMAQKLLDEK